MNEWIDFGRAAAKTFIASHRALSCSINVLHVIWKTPLHCSFGGGLENWLFPLIFGMYTLFIRARAPACVSMCVWQLESSCSRLNVEARWLNSCVYLDIILTISTCWWNSKKVETKLDSEQARRRLGKWQMEKLNSQLNYTNEKHVICFSSSTSLRCARAMFFSFVDDALRDNNFEYNFLTVYCV